jgi:hypothetical protein
MDSFRLAFWLAAAVAFISDADERSIWLEFVLIVLLVWAPLACFNSESSRDVPHVNFLYVRKERVPDPIVHYRLDGCSRCDNLKFKRKRGSRGAGSRRRRALKRRQQRNKLSLSLLMVNLQKNCTTIKVERNMNFSVRMPGCDDLPFNSVAYDLISSSLSEDEANYVRNYARVNPTTTRKVAALMKFDGLFELSKGVADELNGAVDCLSSFLVESIDNQLVDEFRWEMDNIQDFSRIKKDLTSAVGWPLNKRFTAIGDDLPAVEELARNMYDSYDFMSVDAVFCPGGRGKICPLDGTLSARLVLYLGAQYNIMGAKYSQPFTRYFIRMRKVLPHCLGMSWMHGGTDELVNEFEAALDAPFDEILHFCEDISRWDATLSVELLTGAKRVHMAMLHALQAPARFSAYFSWLYDVMIKGTTIFGVGWLVSLFRGMKSGWILTAVDNTIIHIFLFAILATRRGYTYRQAITNSIPGFFAKFYGDDNRCGKLPSCRINAKDFADIYGDFGLKAIGGRTFTYDPTKYDFLSMYITKIFVRGKWRWVPTRPMREVMIRAIKPDRPVVPKSYGELLSIALDSFVGLYYINFWCSGSNKLRTAIQKIVAILKVETITLKEDSFATTIARFLGSGKTDLPCLPSKESMLDLWFGDKDVKRHASFPISGINYTVPNKLLSLERPSFLACTGHSDGHVAEKFEQFMRELAVGRLRVNPKRDWRIKRTISPFPIVPKAMGTAGMKFAEVITKLFSGIPSRCLMIGCHPGSDLRMCRNLFPDVGIVGVSVHPPEDPVFCPKFTDRSNCELHSVPFNDFSLEGTFDFVWCDAASGHETLELESRKDPDLQLKLVGPMMRRCIRHGIPKLAFKLTGFSPLVEQWLYSLYRRSSFFDFIKPQFSYPFNNEFYVFCTLGTAKTKLLTFGEFKSKCNVWRDNYLLLRLSWNLLREHALRHNVKRNPLQYDSRWLSLPYLQSTQEYIIADPDNHVPLWACQQVISIISPTQVLFDNDGICCSSVSYNVIAVPHRFSSFSGLAACQNVTIMQEPVDGRVSLAVISRNFGPDVLSTMLNIIMESKCEHILCHYVDVSFFARRGDFSSKSLGGSWNLLSRFNAF